MNTLHDKARILIVDDDAISAEILSANLDKDYRIMIADSGGGALEFAQKNSPDLILLDIGLPDITGHEVCRALKNNDGTRDIPVIFTTARDTDEDELLGLNLGASDYFTKPYTMPLVLARIAIQIDLKLKTDLLDNLANLDGLTGIPNRRNFDIQFDQEWRRARRNNTELSLCMMDVDFFKQYNDNYGHAQGDRCLKTIAAILNMHTKRAGDFVARYGGEEFVVMLPVRNLDEAKQFTEVLRKAIVEEQIPHLHSKCADHITMSFGVASVLPNGNIDMQKLLVTADKQLYVAKHSGRNCTSAIQLTDED